MLLTLLFSVTLSGCERSEDRQGTKQFRVLRLAHGLQTKHPVHQAMTLFAKELKTLSSGQLRVEIYPSEQLGSEKECLELCQMGILDMAKASAAPLEGFIEEMKVFGLPYLFRDDQHMWRVFDGEVAKKILRAGRDRGLTGLCFYDAGARSFYSTKKAIRSPADLKGMKIRVQKSEMAIRMIDAMGGSPTPIDWGELYTALQQGVVDGAENNRPSFQLSQHYETCKYYCLDEHLRQPDVLIINTGVWESLSKQQQQWMNVALQKSVSFQRRKWQETAQKAIEVVKKSGVTVIQPDKSKFREAVQPLWRQFDKTIIGELAREIQAVK